MSDINWSLTKSRKDLGLLLSFVHDISSRYDAVHKNGSDQDKSDIRVMLNHVLDNYVPLFQIPEKKMQHIQTCTQKEEAKILALELFEEFLFDLNAKLKKDNKDKDL